MPQPRKLDPTALLFWDTQGVTAVEMQRRLADEGTNASIDLIRLRLREARREAQGEPTAPRPQRKSSATARRQGQLAEAVKLLSDLQADLEGVVVRLGRGLRRNRPLPAIRRGGTSSAGNSGAARRPEHRLGVGQALPGAPPWGAQHG